jgi:hypothetical protein
VPVAPEAELELGDGAVLRHRVGDLIPVYRFQRALLQRLLDDHYAADTPVRLVGSCLRCPLCTEQLRAKDALLLVAGMRITQREKLLDAGITTITELASHAGPVPDLAAGAVDKLTAQAKLQVRQRDTGTPQFGVADTRPLGLLPEPSPGGGPGLTPGPPLPTTALRQSIEMTAAAVAAGLPQLPNTALIDILLRRSPRMRSGAALPRSADSVAEITAAVLDLDSSYLAVHGPPGTGKTHTTVRVITKLVTDHAWRIGVVAQSHAAVENLLDCVIDAGLDPGRVARRRPRRSSLRFSVCSAGRGPMSTAPCRWPPPTCWCWHRTTPRRRCCAGDCRRPVCAPSGSEPSTSSRARRRRSSSSR